MSKLPVYILTAACWSASLSLASAQTPSTPASAPSHSCGAANGVDERGDKGMGFSHELTGHHFYLFPDGGAIAVAANNPADAESRTAIRTHLTMIAAMFSEGNFSIPMFVHDTVPPGVETMKELRGAISYNAEPMNDGAQVTIRTKDAKALEAIHKFLRFQIADHRTGDPVEVRK